MKQETKVFLYRAFGTAFAAFLTALVGPLRELAVENYKFLIALAVVNGLLAALHTFLDKKTTVYRKLGLK